MKIAFDAQLLFEKNKTGVGWVAKQLMDHIIEKGDDDCQLNCFPVRHRKEKFDILEPYGRRGCKICACRWLPWGVYQRLWKYLPIPYHWLMGQDAQITQFFNFVVPPGVKGKTSVVVHDMVVKACPETMNERTREYLEKNLEVSCHRADVIIAVSEFTKREIVKYLQIDANKIYVVPNGVDLERYRPDYSVEEVSRARENYGIPQRYLLYLGTLEPRKNIETLIDAYAQLKMKNANAPALILAGKKGWLYEEILHKVEQYHLEQDVIFTGYIDAEDAPKLLKGAEVFVFPSVYEGFGMPPLEAMACGTPVLVSDAAALVEVVGNAGAVVPYTTDGTMADCMAEKLNELLEREELRSEYSKKGLERASGFTWEKSAECLLAVYKKAIGGNDAAY